MLKTRTAALGFVGSLTLATTFCCGTFVGKYLSLRHLPGAGATCHVVAYSDPLVDMRPPLQILDLTVNPRWEPGFMAQARAYDFRLSTAIAGWCL